MPLNELNTDLAERQTLKHTMDNILNTECTK